MFSFSLEIPVFEETDIWWKKTQKDYVQSGQWKEDIKPYWEDEKDPTNSEPWLPRKDNLPHKILRKTGIMQDKAKIHVKGKLFNVKTTSYGPNHQTGLGDRLPQRRWLGIPDESLIHLSEISTKYIIKRNGRRIKF